MARGAIFLKSFGLGLAAAGFCLTLAVFIPILFRPAVPHVAPVAGAAPAQSGGDDFTVSTTDELMSVETWRSPYGLVISLAVLIITSVCVHHRLNRSGKMGPGRAP
jgi:hypothetical protein